MLTYFTFSGLYASQRHLAFETGVFDTGVYTQPLWNYNHGRGFAVSTIEDNGPLRWATHVEPILFLIAPLYALLPDPRTLYWLQAGVLTLAALPMYALARRRLQSEWVALVIVLAYFLLPATQSVTLFDFHAVTFAPLYYAAYRIGTALIGEGKPRVTEASLEPRGEGIGPLLAFWWGRITALGKPLLLGLAILACTMGLSAYLLITLLWRLKISWAWRQRKRQRASR